MKSYPEVQVSKLSLHKLKKGHTQPKEQVLTEKLRIGTKLGLNLTQRLTTELVAPYNKIAHKRIRHFPRNNHKSHSITIIEFSNILIVVLISQCWKNKFENILVESQINFIYFLEKF